MRMIFGDLSEFIVAPQVGAAVTDIGNNDLVVGRISDGKTSQCGSHTSL